MLFLAMALGGCAGTVNPSFAITSGEARAALYEMRRDPQPLQRPVLVLNGYMDPGLAAAHLADRIRSVSIEPHVINVAFAFEDTFADCRQKLLDAVDRAFPGDDPLWTQEVDVVAVSMGGLVARDAAAENGGARRLRIARLFTISTPHQGAAMASLPSFRQLHSDMRPGSAFLQQLSAAAETADYEVISYVRLDDMIVGEENASLPGAAAWWVANQPLQSSHGFAFQDPRILADIARRLRNEQPYTTDPAAPLPQDE